MRWNLLILCLSSFLLYSCHSPFPEYTSSGKGFYYQYHKIGEQNQTVALTDYVTADISYHTLTDSLFFSAKRQFQLKDPDYSGSIDECFLKMSIGDSATFILPAKQFFSLTLGREVPSFIDSTGFFKVSINLLNRQSEEQFEKEKLEFLAWIEDFAIYEKTKLSNYLSSRTNDYKMESQGFYKLIVEEGAGDKVKRGDTLVLNYEGKFLNGKYFDSTYKRNRSFEYIYGTEWQVIKGMEMAVSGMKEGEKSIFVLPSELAFGNMGNSNGAIPPFSTLIYEIKLEQIRN
jgi:FKBP-type peptidyl-prolyl cis-trans isomerase